MQSQAEVPVGVAGLNWGAFFLNWIWAIGNQVWIGLLALIPCINLFVAIFLLIKGNELAWNGPRQWESPEQFQAVQQAWTKWGLVVFAIGIILTVLQWATIAAMLFHGAASGPSQ